VRITLLLLLCGCIYKPSTGPAVDMTPRPSPQPAPEKPRAHDLRFGWTAWNSDSTLFYCNRRLDDNGNPIGVTGPCFKVRADDPNPHRLVAFLNVNQAEKTPPNAAPPGCRIELEDAQLVPQKKPARAWLVGHAGKKLLEEWLPDAEGDVFVVETTPSPDGKLLGILRVAIGIGEGERTVEIAGARVIPAPSCN
jgi:hypothetical protein